MGTPTHVPPFNKRGDMSGCPHIKMCGALNNFDVWWKTSVCDVLQATFKRILSGTIIRVDRIIKIRI